MSEWLDTRTPRPPQELVQRLQEIVGDSASAQSDLPRVMIDKAITVLQSVGGDREAAADLLAADALVTYAMEASADAHDDLGEFARECAIRIAGIASR